MYPWISHTLDFWDAQPSSTPFTYQKVKANFLLLHKMAYRHSFWSFDDWDSCVLRLDWEGILWHSADHQFYSLLKCTGQMVKLAIDSHFLNNPHQALHISYNCIIHQFLDRSFGRSWGLNWLSNRVHVALHSMLFTLIEVSVLENTWILVSLGLHYTGSIHTVVTI